MSAPEVADVPAAFVTVTSTVPDVPAGDVAVICVELLTVTAPAEVAPNLTVDAEVKLVPVMTTAVPPVGGPVVGLIEVIAGAGSVP
jgi:hypothetical protein